MKTVQGKNRLWELARLRESLIFQYQKGDLSKKEYIQENHDVLVRFQAKPFRNVDHFDKAVFNYHFFNTMAKYCQMMSEDSRIQKKHPELLSGYLERKDRYYHRKDQNTWKAVQLLDFQGVEAYEIRVSSRSLKDRLFEIIFLKFPEIVFHSRGQWLKQRLADEGLFVSETRRSVIERYVNETY